MSLCFICHQPASTPEEVQAASVLAPLFGYQVAVIHASCLGHVIARLGVILGHLLVTRRES